MDALSATIAGRIDDEVAELLARYVAIPCLSPDFAPGGSWAPAIDEAIDLLVGDAAQRSIDGLSIEVQRIEGRTPAIVIEAPATLGASGGALIYGHLDKQPPLGSWSEGLGPYEAVRRGELLFGRGVADDGYALPTALRSIEAMDEAGIARPRCLLLIEASEESGSPDLPAHLDGLGSRLDGTDLVICLDSGALDYERLWVTTSLRGNITLTLTAAVLEHGVHSGSAGGLVPSSFAVLRTLLDRIEDPATGEVRLGSLEAVPPDHVLAQAAIVDRILDDPLSRRFPLVGGVELMGRDGVDRILRQSWGASLSITGASGLPPIGEAGNVLRPSSSLKLSLRTPPGVDAASVADELVERLLADPPHGASVSVDDLSAASGWLSPPAPSWLLDALDEASEAAFGNPAAHVGEGGSIPFLAELGIRFPHAAFVVTGVLGPGSNAHGPDESLHLPTAAGVGRSVISVLAALAEASGDAP